MTLLPDSGTLIDIRSMNTLVDNYWYTFPIATGRGYDLIYIELNDEAVVAGYRVELYTKLEDNRMVKHMPLIDGTPFFPVREGNQYFMRVTAGGATNLTGMNYEIRMLPIVTPAPPSPPTQVASIQIERLGGVDGPVTYLGQSRHRIRGNHVLTVTGLALSSSGIPVPNTLVTVLVHNPNWSHNANNMDRFITVQTDNNGRFIANLQMAPSTGAWSHWITGPQSFVHFFDNAYLGIASGGIDPLQIPLWIFAFSR